MPKQNDGKGTYILILHLENDISIQVGKLGKLKFKKGYYAYVGSAFGPGGIKSRLKHHIHPLKKKLHWHIDYLRKEASIKEVWVSDCKNRLEHEWGSVLENIVSSEKIPGFGCSDCKCDSHIFHFKVLNFMKDFQNEIRKKSIQTRVVSYSSFLIDLKKELGDLSSEINLHHILC